MASLVYWLMLCVPRTRGFNRDGSLMVWSDSLDEESNDDDWIIYGSVHYAIDSHHCPSSMNCWKLSSTTHKIATSITTSIPTQDYSNFTLSYGITITDTLATLSSHRDYCRIYYKTNHIAQSTTVENWKLLASYYVNATNQFANKLPLQSHRLPHHAQCQSIDIRFMNSANDAVPSISCYVDEISLTADDYSPALLSSARMKTIFIVLIILSTIMVCMILSIGATKLYSHTLAKDQSELIHTVKVSNADSQHVDSVSGAGSNTAGSPTPLTPVTHRGEVRVSTPISAIVPENTTPLNTIKSDTPSHANSNDAEVMDESDPNAGTRRDTQNQLSDIMHEVLRSPSNCSARASEKLDTMEPVTANRSDNDEVPTDNDGFDVMDDHEIDGFEYTQYTLTQFSNAPKRESESFQSYEVDFPNTFTQTANEEHHSSVSFADDSVMNTLKNRYPAKKETLSNKTSGASSTTNDAPAEDSNQASKDADAVYDSSVAFALYDEEEKCSEKRKRKFTQHREEESLDVDGSCNKETFNEISICLPAQQYSDRAPDHKAESGTEMSDHVTMETQDQL